MKDLDNLRWVMLGVLACLNKIEYFFIGKHVCGKRATAH